MKVIVIAQARWIFIGDMERTADGIKLTDTSVIRYWGTTAGLGQIALTGVTSKTILDPCGTVVIPTTSVIGIIECTYDNP